ncbi:MAG: VOC family protein [Candidatus Woesebacteria bacterium]
MNSVHYFEIQADDPTRAVNFYVQIFDWKFTKDDALAIDYWRITEAGINGGLLKRPAPAPKPPTGTNAYTCSIEVVDFDVCAEKILKNGGVVALEKFAVPGVCWQGYFLDTEGNTFGLFQPDKEAK